MEGVTWVSTIPLISPFQCLYMMFCVATGALRAEKVDLSAQVKKQQANMQYQQSRIEQLNKEVSTVVMIKD